MSYTKTNWNSGDIITAQKLNKIEDGIEQSSGGDDTDSTIIVDFGDLSDYDGEDLEFTIQTGLTPSQLLKSIVFKFIEHINGNSELPIVEIYTSQIESVQYLSDYNISLLSIRGMPIPGMFYISETGLLTTVEPDFANMSPSQPAEQVPVINPEPIQEPIQEQY